MCVYDDFPHFLKKNLGFCLFMPIKKLINKIFIVLTCFAEISRQNVSSFVREWMEWKS